MLACITLVILPLLLPLLAHGAAILLSVAALSTEPVPLDPWHAATVRPSAPVAQAATRSAPCKVAFDRQEARAYPRPVVVPERAVRVRYSAAPGPYLTAPSVL
jgi:hypothetical protein